MTKKKNTEGITDAPHKLSQVERPIRKMYIRPQVVYETGLVTRAGSGPLGGPLGDSDPLGLTPLDSDGFGYQP